MKNHKNKIHAFLSFGVMILLIFDSKTAINGAKEGLDLCIKTLIPSLYPFLVITTICGNSLTGANNRVIRGLLKPCKLPNGTEHIFLLGILGGYPLGAKLLEDAYTQNLLSKRDAERMLMFCSNAGPSFLFGIIGSQFESLWMPWLIWTIHIVAAYLVGFLTSQNTNNVEKRISSKQPIESLNIPTIIQKAIKSMSTICAWVTLFRVLIAFLDKWFLSNQPVILSIVIKGLLELSNGSIHLAEISNITVRFMVSLFIICAGGFCIVMQTNAIAPSLSIKSYLIGKVYQSAIALLLALPSICIISHLPSGMVFVLLLLQITIVFLLHKTSKKKVVAFRKIMLYNIKK